MKGQTIIWATLDKEHGRALITGFNHQQLLREVVDNIPARWSRTGRGYVLSMVEVADLCCLASVRNVIYRERNRPT